MLDIDRAVVDPRHPGISEVQVIPCAFDSGFQGGKRVEPFSEAAEVHVGVPRDERPVPDGAEQTAAVQPVWDAMSVEEGLDEYS
jgi:hypothetical protein